MIYLQSCFLESLILLVLEDKLEMLNPGLLRHYGPVIVQSVLIGVVFLVTIMFLDWDVFIRYEKHIRYVSRKVRAESRTRIKGRFAKMDMHQ